MQISCRNYINIIFNNLESKKYYTTYALPNMQINLVYLIDSQKKRDLVV